MRGKLLHGRRPAPFHQNQFILLVTLIIFSLFSVLTAILNRYYLLLMSPSLPLLLPPPPPPPPTSCFPTVALLENIEKHVVIVDGDHRD